MSRHYTVPGTFIRRATTRAALRKMCRCNRPIHWGFPHWCEHGRNASYRWLNARGKGEQDFYMYIDPMQPEGQKTTYIDKATDMPIDVPATVCGKAYSHIWGKF